MALNDLIRNITVVAGLALVPASLGCEGDSTTNVYEGSGGGSGDYTCKNVCYEKLPKACPSPDWVGDDSEDCMASCVEYTSNDSSKVKAYFECVVSKCSEDDAGERCAGYY